MSNVMRRRLKIPEEAGQDPWQGAARSWSVWWSSGGVHSSSDSLVSPNQVGLPEGAWLPWTLRVSWPCSCPGLERVGVRAAEQWGAAAPGKSRSSSRATWHWGRPRPGRSTTAKASRSSKAPGVRAGAWSGRNPRSCRSGQTTDCLRATRGSATSWHGKVQPRPLVVHPCWLLCTTSGRCAALTLCWLRCTALGRAALAPRRSAAGCCAPISQGVGVAPCGKRRRHSCV